MSEKVKQKFDGYAEKYDEWFMKNENLFTSELRLYKKVLGDITEAFVGGLWERTFRELHRQYRYRRDRALGGYGKDR